MQHTFQLNASNLTPGFLDTLRKLFGDKEIKVVVEDVKPNDTPQQDLYRSLMALREEFKDFKVDPSIDISKLADEVNL
ncbi:hypothetical protein [Dyadobacter fermentans]|uniref:hypothetical protein n=1 Tax=Dyadobacter fermentans TaxID=94254 RepID=UPI001CBA75D1|nr:hypothetical protein [Dyadobacter fermentans]MBZ1362609.1 hypothetical protein [Dyadobacter fermentans]